MGDKEQFWHGVIIQKKKLLTQISLLKLWVGLHLQFLNWELQKISIENSNRKTLHDCFLYINKIMKMEHV